MNSDSFSVSLIVGWVLMIASWVIPLLTKDEKLKRLFGLSLSALSLGIFIAMGIQLFID